MKRLIAIMLILLTVILFGCSKEEQEYVRPVNFYYPRLEPGYGQADSLIWAEVREGNNYDTVALLALYFQGPSDPDSRSIFPSGTRMMALEFAEDTLVITLSDPFASLTGVELNLACACIYSTGSELFDLKRVEIRTENTLLDGKASIIVDRSTYLLQDDIVTPASTGGTE